MGQNDATADHSKNRLSLSSDGTYSATANIDLKEGGRSQSTAKEGARRHDGEGGRHVFDHDFSGWSVWLEPEPTEFLRETMACLRASCGGPPRGVHPFVPHLTLLYNVPPESFRHRRRRRGAADGDDEVEEEEEEDDDEAFSSRLRQRLEDVWRGVSGSQDTSDAARSRSIDSSSRATHSVPPEEVERDEPAREYPRSVAGMTTEVASTESDEIMTTHTVKPCDWFAFHYPKSADNGTGFGATIALLWVENEPWLQALYETCNEEFGCGQRSGFQPHLSLVYAPEAKRDFLRDYVASQKQQNGKRNRPKRLRCPGAAVPCRSVVYPFGARKAKLRIGTE